MITTICNYRQRPRRDGKLTKVYVKIKIYKTVALPDGPAVAFMLEPGFNAIRSTGGVGTTSLNVNTNC